MRLSVSTFKSKAGLFVQDQYVPLIEGFINLITSLVLLQYLGLAGIFLGTTISTITTVWWTQPSIVYKNVFNRSVWSYFIKYGFFAVLTLVTCFVTTYICNVTVIGDSFISLVARGIICLSVPNILYIAIFYRNTEFQYMRKIISGVLLSRLKVKLTFKSKTKGV